ncbi:hypothetical protein OK015_21370 [Mycobacterium sp. Aquia_216]|uniref:hypothetical protein n=1 Tax=Mycobacterium sp. Aquia_216 TaxID=2991729 RepID=UPI00227A76C6|nr:hypothetical protein [Mycobacterium sp. Aquia_216]WAJ43716.1 hypothetical protein OK015_21370 [Mycobacterium sp. Aquia_216]
MPRDIQVVTRPVRQITLSTRRPWSEFRRDYERAVPHFDHLEAVGVALSGSGWDAIRRLSEATAVEGFVNFFVFDPSPVMHLNGSTGNAVTYLIGNIIKAEPGFRQHPGCFLYVPLRVVIASDDAGDAQLTIDHPADLLSAYGDPVLDSVAKEFCRVLVALLIQLDVPVPPELAHVS